MFEVNEIDFENVFKHVFLSCILFSRFFPGLDDDDDLTTPRFSKETENLKSYFRSSRLEKLMQFKQKCLPVICKV